MNGATHESPARLTSAALSELVFLSDPRMSDDGRRAFCVRTTVRSTEAGVPEYRAQVCEVDLSGDPSAASLRVLAEGPHGADHPRPSPDGRYLAFLAVREGHDEPQVQCLDLEFGGEARPLTRLASGAREFSWHPDGASLLVVGSDEAPAPKGERVVARSVTRLHAKEDGLPFPGVRTSPAHQLWHVPVSGERPARRTTSFPDGVSDAACSGDGRTVWILAAETIAEADEWRSSLWRLDLTDEGPAGDPQRVLGGLTMAGSLTVGGEDGRTLAWFAPTEPEDPTSVQGLWTMETSSGVPLLRTGEVAAVPAVGGDARHGRYSNAPVWTPGGWIVNANRGGASAPCLVTADGEVRPLGAGPATRVCTAFSHAAGRTLTVVETPQRPGELALVDADGRERALSDENGDFVRRYGLVAGGEERRAPNGADGVPWWRLDPARPREDGAIVVQVHGGPRTNVGYGFQFEFQLLAAHGYAVVSSNPRGSSSYGRAYGQAMLGAYGSVDADDVLAVVDAAAEEARAAGSGRPADVPIHLTGGSYGGFMTNWLVTRTDRFRSAVTQRSICNWISFYGTSDIGYRFTEAEAGGDPWNDMEALWAQSPLSRVEHVVTPILILHADEDHRCPVEQAEQWFVALSRIGKAETRLVRFPGESHELSRSGRPDRRIRRLDEILGWFEAHA